MGKIRIKLLPDGSIKMETEGIKGAKCVDYAKVLERLADAKIEKVEKHVNTTNLMRCFSLTKSKI